MYFVLTVSHRPPFRCVAHKRRLANRLEHRRCINIISIPDPGPDPEAANRLDTADEWDPGSGLFCICTYRSQRPVLVGSPTGSSDVVNNIHLSSRTLDLTRRRLIVWIPLTSPVRRLGYLIFCTYRSQRPVFVSAVAFTTPV